MWDAIIVGSGIGGLAAAAVLGKRGHRVLLLERHSVAGGQTQTFRRGAWEFATGVHYVSGVGPHAGADGQFGRLLGWLTEGALQFAPCANPYDIVRLPGFEFGVPHPESAYRDALLARFPAERAAIERWFGACREARGAAFTLMALHGMPAWLATGLRLLRGRQVDALARFTLGDALTRVGDPMLRAVLGARWGDHGAPPGSAPFVEHALVMGAYDGGAYYPIGGPSAFARTLLPALRGGGGECRLGASVEGILMQEGRVIGVTYTQAGVTRTETAGHVISDIGAANTAGCLPEGAAPAWRDALRVIEPGLGFVALYVGLDGDLAATGASSANHWIYEGADVGRIWRRPADENAPGLFVSFPSLKDPAWAGPPTAEVLALVDREAFAPWIGGTGDASAGRKADYTHFKQRVASRLLAQFGRHFPALAPMVRFHEAATPRTQQRFTRTVGGAMYGLEMNAARLGSPSLNVRTPVPGLLLAGQDVAGPGVQAAFMAGVMAAAAVDAGVWRDLGR
jgi:all-trans-retinol 13,14-reductase